MSAGVRQQSFLEQAVAQHNRGALAEAARLYQRTLRAAPRAFEPTFLLGLLRLQQGDLAEAERRLRSAVEIQPQHADAWFQLGEVLSQSSRDADAAAAYAECSRLEPPHALGCFKFGAACEARGDARSAQNAYERALSARRAFPEALNNLAVLLRASGDVARAEQLLREAITLRPGFPPPSINLAGVLSERGEASGARAVLQQAIERGADSAALHFQLAVLLDASGEREQAVAAYERVLALEPQHAQAYNNAGVLFLEAGFMNEAQTCFERALGFDPALAEAQNNLGNLFTQLERHGEARTAFERAIELRPSFAEPYNGLGMLLAELDEVDRAVACFRSALERRPAFPEAAANLGTALQRLGDLDAARRWYGESLGMRPNLALEIKAATMLSPIPHSSAALTESRRALERGLDALLAAGGCTTEEDLLRYPDTAFYLAYHGMNDRVILEKLAALHAQACPSLLYRAERLERAAPGGRRIRVGFVSRFFGNHSVGNFFNPIIEHLAADSEFEVHLFPVGYRQDATLAKVAAACHDHLALSPHRLDAARSAIEQRELDILVYADIGMDPFTYLLAFSRLAPVQCVLHGHSDTSGIAQMDYFVSTRNLEPDIGQELYSERLVLLDELPMYLRQFPAAGLSRSREELGLPPDGRLYVCPMKLHKIHPDMDALVARILQRDLEGHVVFFEDNRNASWAPAVQARLARALHDPAHARRVVFLPFAADVERFRAILTHADVALDTPHHGGGTTCNLCFSVGTPVVSFVGATCRGRGPFVFYQRMGICDGLAATFDEYVDAAVGIATDPPRRERLHRAIVERRDAIYRNDEVLAAYRDLFRRMGLGLSLPLAQPAAP